MKEISIRGVWLSLLGFQSRFFGLLALSRVSKVVEQLPIPNTDGSKILIVGGGNIDDGDIPDFEKYDIICFSNSSLLFAPDNLQVQVLWFFTPAFNEQLKTVDAKKMVFICVGNPPRWDKKNILKKVSMNSKVPVNEFQVIQESDERAKSSLIYKGLRRFVWLTTGTTGLLWVIENQEYSSIDILGYDLYQFDSHSPRLGHSIPVERQILKELVRQNKVRKL